MREVRQMTKVEFRMHDTHMSSSGDMIVSGYVNQTEQLSHELGMSKIGRAHV